METKTQERVRSFLETHDLETEPAYRVLDLLSEAGEVAKEVNTSTEYGTTPTDVSVARDELGDTLFALLALCVELEVDAEAALETSLAKYEKRLEERESAGSGA